MCFMQVTHISQVRGTSERSMAADVVAESVPGDHHLMVCAAPRTRERKMNDAKEFVCRVALPHSLVVLSSGIL